MVAFMRRTVTNADIKVGPNGATRVVGFTVTSGPVAVPSVLAAAVGYAVGRVAPAQSDSAA
jgi:hypothetical protein